MNNDFGFENLATAIIMQAVIDYSESLTALEMCPINQGARNCCKVLENFFHSDYFHMLTNIDPDYLIEQTRKRTYEEIRQKKRSYSQSSANRQ